MQGAQILLSTALAAVLWRRHVFLAGVGAPDQQQPPGSDASWPAAPAAAPWSEALGVQWSEVLALLPSSGLSLGLALLPAPRPCSPAPHWSAEVTVVSCSILEARPRAAPLAGAQGSPPLRWSLLVERSPLARLLTHCAEPSTSLGSRESWPVCPTWQAMRSTFEVAASSPSHLSVREGCGKDGPGGQKRGCHAAPVAGDRSALGRLAASCVPGLEPITPRDTRLASAPCRAQGLPPKKAPRSGIVSAHFRI